MRQIDFVTLRKNLFLPVEWKVIAIFADDHLGQQPGSGDAAFEQTLRQGRDHRSQIGIGAVNKLAANRPAAQKAGRFVIELLGDFLPDAAPVLRLRFDRIEIDHLFNDGKILRYADRAILADGHRASFSTEDDAEEFSTGLAESSGIASSNCNCAGSSASLLTPKRRRAKASSF